MEDYAMTVTQNPQLFSFLEAWPLLFVIVWSQHVDVKSLYIRIKYRQLHFNRENISNASCLEVE